MILNGSMKKKQIFRSILIVLLLHFNVIKTNAQSDFKRLFNAIAYVESKHNEKLVSKGGKHVGVVQMSKISVDECNRIIGKKKYCYNDRYSAKKSEEMFLIIQSFHNKTNDIEKAIRLWNGGPKASKRKTERYYRKVIKVYNRLKD